MRCTIEWVAKEDLPKIEDLEKYLPEEDSLIFIVKDDPRIYRFTKVCDEIDTQIYYKTISFDLIIDEIECVVGE